MDKIQLLTRHVKDPFTKEFLENYLSPGFGSLTKQDTDLLVYHLIQTQTELFKNKSHYDISNILSLPENKIKKMALESMLKFGSIDDNDCINRLLREIENKNIKPELENDKIKIQISDPLLKRAIEQKIRQQGYLVDFSFNKDILSLKLYSLIQAIKSNNHKKGEKLEREIIKQIKTNFAQDQEIQNEIKKKSSLMTIWKKIKNKSPDIIASLLIKVVPSLVHALL